MISPHLQARVVRDVDLAPVPGAFVLYWMRIAARGHENAALDVAIEAGNALGLPVLVYHAVSERYPYASDRHHTFLLEGARDAREELEARGVAYAFHLERPGARGPVLKRLAEQAALVVTELAPVPPLREWTAALGAHLRAAGVPLWSVDASCVVPMPSTRRAEERAFAFRAATADAARVALATPWVEAVPRHRAALGDLPPLPFEDLDLRGADLPALVGTCAIDHGVAPVPSLRGGSRAGYARWQRFRDRVLDRYDRVRNDPLREGTSRMSAYLHYGHVSVLRLARDAAARRTSGAGKWLDEVLVWRELAWHGAFHAPAWTAPARAPQCLPDWARATLKAHEADRRGARDEDALARGRTGDVLWDACQRSLLRHGELHNNLRMTWGKAFLGWSRDGAQAFARALELNHRYALDGRDPASWSGVGWCFGRHDRPFEEAPVRGTIRPRPTAEHARRLDVDAYATHVDAPVFATSPRIVVVGAGLAGALLARTLQDHGLGVTVLDKARGPGGRTSTRRGEVNGGPVRWDHGADGIELDDPVLRERARAWAQAGALTGEVRHGAVLGDAGWRAEGVPRRAVGVGGMNALARYLLTDVTCVWSAAVARVVPVASGYQLLTEDGALLAEADVVLVTAPAPQSARLLNDAKVPALVDALASVTYTPAFVAMLAVDATWSAPADLLRWEGHPVLGSLRAGEPAGDGLRAWTLHAAPAWAEAHLEGDVANAAELLVTAARDAVGLPVPVSVAGHRWRFSQAAMRLRVDCLAELVVDADTVRGVGACGDAFGGADPERAPAGGGEAALRSALALAGEVLRACARAPHTWEASGVAPSPQGTLFPR